MGAAGISTLGFDTAKTQGAMRGANPENFNIIIDGHAMREPRRMIYIHTVAKRPFGPITRNLFKRLPLRGCGPGERSTLCCAIPDPVPESIRNEMTGGNDIKEHDGWRAAIDLLNPANLTHNPYSGDGNPDFYSNRSGQNLICEGYWPSLYREAPEEEINGSEKRRDLRYRYLTGEATRLAAISTVKLNEFLLSNPDTHIAMDALKMKATWHASSSVTATCPNCGDEVAQGLAFHKSSVTDRLCVIDPEKAYRAKAITREEYDELTGVEEETSEKPRRQSRMKPIT